MMRTKYYDVISMIYGLISKTPNKWKKCNLSHRCPQIIVRATQPLLGSISSTCEQMSDSNIAHKKNLIFKPPLWRNWQCRLFLLLKMDFPIVPCTTDQLLIWPTCTQCTIVDSYREPHQINYCPACIIEWE